MQTTMAWASYFRRLDPPLGPVPSDNKVEAAPFLKAAKQIGPFLDLLGKAFIPVKNDIDGNVKTLQKKLYSNPEKYRTFHGMLTDEQSESTKARPSAILSLLWLKRALQFECEFLSLIIEDHQTGVHSENMGHHCRVAYDRTLKPYHSWWTQKIFSLVSRALPWRRSFLKALAYNVEGKDDEVIADMADFQKLLKSNLDSIQQMYTDMGLDFPDKV